MTASAGDPLPAAALEPAVAPPSELNPLTHVRYAGALAGTLTRHRDLVLEMARRELSDTYAGQALGTAWALLHPILRLAIFLFLFGVVFRVDASTQPGAPPDHTVFLLSGLIPWLAFSEVLSKASSLVHANANLVKQVVFPLEVLPVKSVLASCFGLVVMLGLLAIYAGARQHATWLAFGMLILLPLQFLAMLGTAFGLAAIGAYMRDLKDLVAVYATIGVYLAPVVYLAEMVPPSLRWLLYLNPFSYMSWCYQDALAFGQFAHPWAWPVFGLGACGTAYLGYRLFRRLKDHFGSLL